MSDWRERAYCVLSDKFTNLVQIRIPTQGNTKYVDVLDDVAQVIESLIREARAEAWEEGYTKGYRECYDGTLTINPYKEASDDQV